MSIYTGMVSEAKQNVLTVTYDNQYTHKFCYYASNIGLNKDDYMIPNQFAHNLTLSYSIKMDASIFRLNAAT